LRTKPVVVANCIARPVLDETAERATCPRAVPPLWLGFIDVDEADPAAALAALVS
jgi:hypothetical protein